MCRWRGSSDFNAGVGTLALWVLIAYWRWWLGGAALTGILLMGIHHVDRDVTRELRLAQLEQVVRDTQDVRTLAIKIDDAGSYLSDEGKRLAAFERAERGW